MQSFWDHSRNMDSSNYYNFMLYKNDGLLMMCIKSNDGMKNTFFD